MILRKGSRAFEVRITFHADILLLAFLCTTSPCRSVTIYETRPGPPVDFTYMISGIPFGGKFFIK